jgi:pyruvate/2-oxoglutarate dehydrogenase complex dihydrolipoamide acyltransferase (E2) component
MRIGLFASGTTAPQRAEMRYIGSGCSVIAGGATMAGGGIGAAAQGRRDGSAHRRRSRRHRLGGGGGATGWRGRRDRNRAGTATASEARQALASVQEAARRQPARVSAARAAAARVSRRRARARRRWRFSRRSKQLTGIRQRARRRLHRISQGAPMRRHLQAVAARALLQPPVGAAARRRRRLESGTESSIGAADGETDAAAVCRRRVEQIVGNAIVVRILRRRISTQTSFHRAATTVKLSR